MEIDVAAPETLGPDAVQTLIVKGIPARVYALHRIAGEKLCAYLTSLPPYRRNMQGGDREFRVKDRTTSPGFTAVPLGMFVVTETVLLKCPSL